MTLGLAPSISHHMDIHKEKTFYNILKREDNARRKDVTAPSVHGSRCCHWPHSSNWAATRVPYNQTEILAAQSRKTTSDSKLAPALLAWLPVYQPPEALLLSAPLSLPCHSSSSCPLNTGSPTAQLSLLSPILSYLLMISSRLRILKVIYMLRTLKSEPPAWTWPWTPES